MFGLDELHNRNVVIGCDDRFALHVLLQWFWYCHSTISLLVCFQKSYEHSRNSARCPIQCVRMQWS